jgi:hypothetical protein
MPVEHLRCRGCGQQTSRPFFASDCVPASLGKLPRTPSEAEQVPRGSIQLAACNVCGLVENHTYDPRIIAFEPGYEVSLLHSPTFNRYIKDVCDRLISDYDLRGKRLLEIGCGAAEFLRMICERGGNHGIGIDPTIPRRSHAPCGTGSIELIPDFYSDKHHAQLGDFVCCLSAFEDIPSPLELLKSLRKGIGNRRVPMYFEVFNGFRAIAECEVWSVHYEQCNYFSLESLRNMFHLAGFQVTRSGTCYEGDQYIFVDVMPASEHHNFDCELPTDFCAAVQHFSLAVSNRIDWWVNKLAQCQERGQRVVCWGSGGKGVSFLSSLPNAGVIERVIDINPNRQNHFMPAVSQPIVSPESLRDDPADVVVITNRLYQHEIVETLAAMNLNCETVIA